jgi:predicted HAD superfamily Cof-like phosphohydrolase
MDKNIEQVKEFHELFNIPILSKEETIPVERRRLRLSLLFEELSELADAYGLNKTFATMCANHGKSDLFDWTDSFELNRIESLDAKGDIAYILYGTALEDGDSTILSLAFDDIHQSNMSKACNDLQEALDTIEFYKNKGIESHYVIKNYKYLIYRTYDNKVLKSINYNEFNGDKYFS